MNFKDTLTKWINEEERLVEGDTLDILSMADWFRLIYDQRIAYPSQYKYSERWLFEYMEYGEWYLDWLNKNESKK